MLFFAKGQIFQLGRVVGTAHSPKLAGELWGKSGGAEFEFIYALRALTYVDLQMEAAQRAAGLPATFQVRTLHDIKEGKEEGDLGHNARVLALPELAGAYLASDDELARVRAFQALGLGHSAPRSRASYRLAVASLEQRSDSEASATASTTRRYRRSAAVQAIVLDRANGQCEGIECGGMPSGLSRSGRPFLDVDHAVDLALGGRDHPSNAVALCPNCHAVKTRGVDAEQRRAAYARRAMALHAREMGPA
ncbi:HNH endonuclease [Demequina sp. SYSU T00192]|uniref:HNH endonuclease n=1 Tax=Demequina litoralis TaxID=3051660 RepID=A0ABT8G663_9MICO|nr:HNH endonuclease [Demequina sp. SYSU T00192]MDN4474640.1 HNH endonuclease [Demequina sp. SYSU T00192]